MKDFNFSYKFDYIASGKASLVLMEVSIIIYNIHHSQLCEKVKH